MVPMAKKLGRIVTYLKGLLAIKSFNTLITFLARSRDKKNYYIPTTRVPMGTKLGRMITYLTGLLPIKSNDPLIM